MKMDLFSLAPGRLPLLPRFGFGLVKFSFYVQCSSKPVLQLSSSSNVTKKLGKSVKKSGKREHHLWKRKESAGSGQKAMNLVRIVSGLSYEKEAVYRTLDEWIAWELEFPMLAVAKALRILKNQRQWPQVIQVLADMEELGVKPDEDTVRRVARTFERLGQEDKKNLVIKRYGCKWKYIHFKGERVKVRRDLLVDS